MGQDNADVDRYAAKRDYMNNTFKENVIQQCNGCVVCGECRLDKSDGYCPLEMEVYERFMKALDNEYDNVTEVVRLVAEELVKNMIISNRVSRHLKLKGLTQKVHIFTPDGEEKEYDQENILKQGMHLDINRVIRLFKEMKLTPKENVPLKRQVDIRQVIMNGYATSTRDTPPVNDKRKRKIILQSM